MAPHFRLAIPATATIVALFAATCLAQVGQPPHAKQPVHHPMPPHQPQPVHIQPHMFPTLTALPTRQIATFIPPRTVNSSPFIQQPGINSAANFATPFALQQQLSYANNPFVTNPYQQTFSNNPYTYNTLNPLSNPFQTTAFSPLNNNPFAPNQFFPMNQTNPFNNPWANQLNPWQAQTLFNQNTWQPQLNNQFNAFNVGPWANPANPNFGMMLGNTAGINLGSPALASGIFGVQPVAGVFGFR